MTVLYNPVQYMIVDKGGQGMQTMFNMHNGINVMEYFKPGILSL